MKAASRVFLSLLFGSSQMRAVLSLSSSFCGARNFLRLQDGSARSLRQQRSTATRTPITMMPEGPEVRILVDQLQGGVGRRLLDVRFLSGRYVRNDKPDGFEDFAATMTPYSPATTEMKADVEVDLILSWKAKGKFLYIILDDGLADRSKEVKETQGDFQRSM
jgi:hypothetical protein